MKSLTKHLYVTVVGGKISHENIPNLGVYMSVWGFGQYPIALIFTYDRAVLGTL